MLGERRRHVDRGRRLADAALLVGHDHHPRTLRPRKRLAQPAPLAHQQLRARRSGPSAWTRRRQQGCARRRRPPSGRPRCPARDAARSGWHPSARTGSRCSPRRVLRRLRILFHVKRATLPDPLKPVRAEHLLPRVRPAFHVKRAQTERHHRLWMNLWILWVSLVTRPSRPIVPDRHFPATPGHATGPGVTVDRRRPRRTVHRLSPRWISRSRPREPARRRRSRRPEPPACRRRCPPRCRRPASTDQGWGRGGRGPGPGHRPFFVREAGSGDFVARRRWRGRCASQPSRDGRVASTRTTVVGGSIRSDPARAPSTAPAPYLRSAVVAAAISSCSRRPLHRHQGPTLADQGHRPAEQPLQRRDRAGGHHVELAACRAAPRPAPRTTSTLSRPECARPPRRGRWCAAAGARPGSPTGRAAPVASTSPGSPAPLPMSQTSRALRDRVGQERAVDQVPLPEPRDLAGTDQAADHPVVGQQGGVPLRQRQRESRTPPRRRRRRGCFT